MSSDAIVSAAPEGRPLAYSYIRFSRPEQIKGDSLSRQLKKSREYAREKGLNLVTDYRDLGVSAWQGRNQTEGQLGDFIAAVEQGRIPARSHLLVESLDRISRQRPRVALRHFLHLLELGLTIHTLIDKGVYSDKLLDETPSLLLISIISMSRASEESETKSDRVQSAKDKLFDAAQESGAVMTKQGRAWLRLLEEDGRRRFEAIPERAAIIARMYDMTINGFGAEAIVRILNQEGVPSFSKGYSGKVENGWHKFYVRQILSSRAVLGDFVPVRKDRPTIPGYYPRIIDEVTWERAKKAREDRDHSGGPRVGGWNNLFTGFSYCSACGGTLSVRSKGVPLTKDELKIPPEQRSPRPRRHYFVCENHLRRRGCTNNQHIDYAPMERAILNALWMVSIDPDQLGGAGADIRKVENQMADLKASADHLQARITALAEGDMEIGPALMASIQRMEAKRSEALAARQDLADQLARLRATTPPEDHLETVKLLRDEALSGNVEIRARVNAGLREIVDAVVAVPDRQIIVEMAGGHIGFQFRAGEMVLPWSDWSPPPPDLEQWMAKVPDRPGSRSRKYRIGDRRGALPQHAEDGFRQPLDEAFHKWRASGFPGVTAAKLGEASPTMKFYRGTPKKPSPEQS